MIMAHRRNSPRPDPASVPRPARARAARLKPRIGLLSAWLSRNNGGVFEAVVAHAEMVRAAGFEPVIVGLADQYSSDDSARFGDAEVISVKTAGPRMLGYAPRLDETLRRAGLDLLHLHGIWTDPSRAASRWARSTGRPLVISPHGMLNPWILRHGRWKKAVARLAYERRSWGRASAFHALTEAERHDIERGIGRFGLATVIPNAVQPAPPSNVERSPNFLYLGRIHPMKNVEALVDAWTAMPPPSEARLVIAGWGRAEHVASLTRKLAQASQAEFVGPQFGAAKLALLREARFLCLPSHGEGLPMAILEAWAEGTPTLMSRHCHLDEGFAARAAIDCGTRVDEIAAALRQALAADWGAMSGGALDLVRDLYSTQTVGVRWKSLYDRLLAGSCE